MSGIAINRHMLKIARLESQIILTVFGSNETKAPKHDRQNRLRSPTKIRKTPKYPSQEEIFKVKDDMGTKNNSSTHTNVYAC